MIRAHLGEIVIDIHGGGGRDDFPTTRNRNRPGPLCPRRRLRALLDAQRLPRYRRRERCPSRSAILYRAGICYSTTGAEVLRCPAVGALPLHR